MSIPTLRCGEPTSHFPHHWSDTDTDISDCQYSYFCPGYVERPCSTLLPHRAHPWFPTEDGLARYCSGAKPRTTAAAEAQRDLDLAEATIADAERRAEDARTRIRAAERDTPGVPDQDPFAGENSPVVVLIWAILNGRRYAYAALRVPHRGLWYLTGDPRKVGMGSFASPPRNTWNAFRGWLERVGVAWSDVSVWRPGDDPTPPAAGETPVGDAGEAGQTEGSRS